MTAEGLVQAGRRRQWAKTRRKASLGGTAVLAALLLHLRRAVPGSSFAQPPGRSARQQLPAARDLRATPLEAAPAARAGEASAQPVSKVDADALEFETAKFNLVWMRMMDAKERGDTKRYDELKKEVADLGRVVEQLGGSKPAEMISLEEAREKAAKLREELSFDKLMAMSNEDRWILAQQLGPAFPISLVLSYTIYWGLNVPFIAYAYFSTVVNGQATMAVVMAGAYTTSLFFKPLVYIGGLLMTGWTAENIMPPLGKLFSLFKPPGDEDWDRL